VRSIAAGRTAGSTVGLKVVLKNAQVTGAVSFVMRMAVLKIAQETIVVANVMETAAPQVAMELIVEAIVPGHRVLCIAKEKDVETIVLVMAVPYIVPHPTTKPNVVSVPKESTNRATITL